MNSNSCEREEVRRLQTTRSPGCRARVEGDRRWDGALADDAGQAIGVTWGAKTIGKDYGPAPELWDSMWFEARMLAAFVDDPLVADGAQMDGWAVDSASWAVCDTACFSLFYRAALRRKKVFHGPKQSRSLLERERTRARRVGPAGVICGT